MHESPIKTSPATIFEAITPDDSTDVNFYRSIYIGSDGNLSVVNEAGVTVAFDGIGSGTTLAISPKRVRATGTTVTGIVGLA